MYKYPYGDSQQLNLDWIIAKLKELEASGGAGGTDLEEVSNALISLTYNTSTAYRRYDYAFLNGKLYRCLTDTSGVFDPPAWQEALIGDDLSVLTRWINAIDAAAVVDVKFDTSGTNGKIQQKYHDQYHDVVEVDYTPVQNSKRPLSSNAGYELNGAINSIKPTLNILVVGNSFNQDMMAYLPPIMKEALPEYDINWCLLYEGSSDFDTHIQMFLDETKYTYTNIWEVNDTAWHRYGKTDANGMTLKQALAYKHWDMVFMQATTSDVQTEALIQTKVITAGRRLMRAIAAYASAPFAFYTFEWLARPNNSSASDPDSEINSNYALIHHATIETVQALGFRDYVPVGTAFQNARTNSTIKALGTGASMLYSDNVHAQAGAPALLGNYVVAAFLCNICGKPNGIINSSFHPSTDNAIAINARTSNNPVGMTHGASSTITNPVKRAIQEIAYITLNNPSHITDCSNIVVNTPT